MFVSFISFDPALYSDNFGLIEKFHTKKVFYIYFLKFQRWCCRRNLIPGGLFIVSWLLISIIMHLPISTFVEALEKQLLSIFIARFGLFRGRHKKFDFNQFLLGANLLNNLFRIVFESVVTHICFLYQVVVLIVEFPNRQWHVSVFAFWPSSWIVSTMKLDVKCANFRLEVP